MISKEIRLFLGEYAGTVYDNKDPTQQGRIRVRVPEVLGDKISNWCLSRSQYSGQLIIPEIGDMVTVTFKSGDPSLPQYVGVQHQVSKIPSSTNNTLDVSKHGNDQFLSANDETVTEPSPPVRSQYPNILTLVETPYSVIESDRGTGRILIQQKQGGQYIEFHPDGTLVLKVKKIHAYVETDVNLHILKDYSEKTDQNKFVHVGGKAVTRIAGDYIITVIGNWFNAIKQKLGFCAGQESYLSSDKSLSVQSDSDIHLLGKRVDSISRGK